MRLLARGIGALCIWMSHWVSTTGRQTRPIFDSWSQVSIAWTCTCTTSTCTRRGRRGTLWQPFQGAIVNSENLEYALKYSAIRIFRLPPWIRSGSTSIIAFFIRKYFLGFKNYKISFDIFTSKLSVCIILFAHNF